MLEKIKNLFKKGKVQEPNDELKENEVEFEQRPVYAEGYDEEQNTVIRLVSHRKPKTEAYRVSGIEDVVSKNNWKAWLYLFPVLVLIAVFLLYPLINTIFIAFTRDYVYASGKFDGMTFNNFGVILNLTETTSGGRESYFVRYAIPNTLILTFVTVPLSILIALIISVALNSIKWFQKILQTVFFLPYVTNAIAVGMVFAVIFDKNGVINFIFGMNDFKWVYGALPLFSIKDAEGNIIWELSTGMIPLCIYIIWHSLPFKILILLSGLQGIDKQYYQAAQIDSCPKHKVLWKITVPLLSPQILYIMITSFIGSFKEYSSVVGLFNGPGTSGKNGDPNMETIVYYVYENLDTQTSLAAAAAVFLFVLILIFTAIQFAVSKKKVHY